MSMDKLNIEELIISYLDGVISEADSEFLHSWLRSSRDNQKLFLDYYNVWLLSNRPRFDEQKAFERFTDNVIDKSEIKKKRIPLYKYVAVTAACIAILLALPNLIRQESDEIVNFANNSEKVDFHNTKTSLILSDNKTVLLDEKDAKVEYDASDIKINEKSTISKEESSTYNQLVTPYGKRSTIVFADGSKAWVNSGTRVIYPVEFKENQREIYVDGEIYIEVSEDKSRPFIVKSAMLDVKVLGTKFNVSAYGSDIQQRVVLVSGSVQVLPKDVKQKQALLAPRQMYTVSDGNADVQYTNVSQHISWIDGFYNFESMKFGDILNRLSRYYQKDIHFDKHVAELKCTGKLDMKDDLAEVLNGLTNTVPVKCVQNTDQSYTISLK